MAKQITKDQNKTFKKLWESRVHLRINGFLTDSENKKIINRMESYRAKKKLTITNQQLVS